VSAQLTIARLGAQGDGIAETERGPVFVPFSLPGEEVAATIDRDRGALRDLEHALRPGGAMVRRLAADFTKPIDLASLDGVVMANSLHFVRDKAPVLALVHKMLKPSGRLLLVEYDADHGNTWVPHPMSFETWRALADANGFSGTRELASVPSRFIGRIFSAESVRA